jgi:hypothetical protein
MLCVDCSAALATGSVASPLAHHMLGSGRQESAEMYIHPQRGSSELTQKLRNQAGVWLRELRERRGLSQRELAARVAPSVTPSFPSLRPAEVVFLPIVI